MNKVFAKYNIMRIRSKISYMCLEKRMTVSELFGTTILRIFNYMQLKNYYPQKDKEAQDRDDKLKKKLFSGAMRGIIKSLILYHGSINKEADKDCWLLDRV